MDFKDLIISNQLLKLSQYFISMLSNSASKNSFLILLSIFSKQSSLVIFLKTSLTSSLMVFFLIILLTSSLLVLNVGNAVIISSILTSTILLPISLLFFAQILQVIKSLWFISSITFLAPINSSFLIRK